MGITVTLTDEEGKVLASEGDPTNILHRVLPLAEETSPLLLAGIDWYGDTVFNRPQCRRVVRELEELQKAQHEPEAIALLEDVLKLARRCRDGVHLYLKFWGD